LDPSAADFANSVIVFGLAALTFYYLHQHNKFQDRVFGYGMLLGFVIAFSISAFEGDGGAIKDYMPTVITISLLAGACING